MTDGPREHGYDCDVAIVGGGPAGSSAAVFTAREGLETVVFDRGRSSIRQCAHLENYPGFPAGIDVETLYGLLHDHVEEAGGELVFDLVESITKGDDGPGFVVDTQEGRRVTARRVVAATRYDGEYLRELDGDAMFERDDHLGEAGERFDRSYAASDGSTPVHGLYVASPSAESDRQAIVAAGRGARVALTVVEDARVEAGYPECVADHYDWLRREAERAEEWSDRDRWREWFENRLPDDHGLDEDQKTALRERVIDERLDAYVSEVERVRRGRRGHDRLLDHLDDDRVLDHLDDDQVLERAREILTEREANEATERLLLEVEE